MRPRYFLAIIEDMEQLGTPKIKIIERIITGATLLIWIGVLLVAAGLTMAYFDMRAEQQAVAQADMLSFVVENTATPVAPPTATRTPTLTPSPTFALPTSTGSRPTRTFTPTLTPTPTSTPTALPTLAPDSAPAGAPPDRIVISAIALDAAVKPIGWHIEEQDGQKFSVWDVPDNAAGWHETSAYPGEGGNVVLNGHHNIRGEVFRYLIDLEAGAKIKLYVGDRIYYYSVTEKHIIKEKGEPQQVRYENARWIAPTDDERLTLVTCWPYTSNSHRLIIVAMPEEPGRLLPKLSPPQGAS
ncbi:MAG: hypothetical protein B6I34_10140 [Anaerolineaceae bacterium 4572_32.1]|nr:MAG: hypothetical protein B6I34_10140 [Anaerolineaceae bacterium 4572_32.1]